jgi:hypothetical protein
MTFRECSRFTVSPEDAPWSCILAFQDERIRTIEKALYNVKLMVEDSRRFVVEVLFRHLAMFDDDVFQTRIEPFLTDGRAIIDDNTIDHVEKFALDDFPQERKDRIRLKLAYVKDRMTKIQQNNKYTTFCSSCQRDFPEYYEPADLTSGDAWFNNCTST